MCSFTQKIKSPAKLKSLTIFISQIVVSSTPSHAGVETRVVIGCYLDYD